jgi:hypothetical protein
MRLAVFVGSVDDYKITDSEAMRGGVDVIALARVVLLDELIVRHVPSSP